MKPLFCIFFLSTILLFFKGGEPFQAEKALKQISPTPSATVKSAENNKNNATVEEKYECVRSTPEPILDKKIFPKAEFKLEKGKSYPFEEVGYETTTLENGDKLTIINGGCEYFSLTFKWETGKFSKEDVEKKDDTFWYKQAVDLLQDLKKGVKSPATDLKNAVKIIKTYLKKSKEIKLEQELDDGAGEIKPTVVVEKPRLNKEDKVEFEIRYYIGPL